MSKLQLSHHQRTVLQLPSEGHSTEETCYEVGCNLEAFSKTLSRIFDTLKVHTREAAVCYAIRGGAIPGPHVDGVSLDRLSSKERETAVLLPELFTNGRIARRLEVSEQDVVWRLAKCRSKLGGLTRPQLAAAMLKISMKK